MLDNATEPGVLRQIERLCTALGKPYGSDAKAMGVEYTAAFHRQGIPMIAVVAAVTEAIDTNKTGRFPGIGQLIELARLHIPRSDGERQSHGLDDTCPECRMHVFYAGYQLGKDESGPVVPKARCGCPKPDAGWWTEQALAWTEDDDRCRDRLMPRDYRDNPRYRVIPPRKPQRGEDGFGKAVA